jgi:hypothetical protein
MYTDRSRMERMKGGDISSNITPSLPYTINYMSSSSFEVLRMMNRRAGVNKYRVRA